MWAPHLGRDQPAEGEGRAAHADAPGNPLREPGTEGPGQITSLAGDLNTWDTNDAVAWGRWPKQATEPQPVHTAKSKASQM